VVGVDAGLDLLQGPVVSLSPSAEEPGDDGELLVGRVDGKVNPWTTQPSGGPNLRGIVVPNEVVVDLGVVDHDEAPPARLQKRGEVLGAEPGEAITVLDQDRRHLRVRGKPKKLSTPAVQPGTDLGDHAVDRKAVRDSQLHTRATWRSRSSRWSAEDTRA